MLNKDTRYLLLILFHVAIGVVVFIIPPFAKIYGYTMILLSIYWIINNKNANNEVLYAAAYLVGAEVFLRMTNGNPLYEFTKYGIMFLMILGIYFRGFSKNAIPYWIFLALMIPGVIMACYVLNYDTNMRKVISFNISGPFCLGLSALYTYNRRVTLKQLNNIILCIGLPIVTCTAYLILYTPSIRDVVTGTGSNFETSGGFGPNQVATVLGLGMFVFFSRLIFSSFSKTHIIINLIIALNISYRGLVTFSRGGMITGMLMLVILVLITYVKINSGGKVKLNYLLFFFLIAIGGIWTYSSSETGGLINKRYANQDAAGRVKESQLTGRENIIASEIKYFLDNPVMGIGVGKGMELRETETGTTILSHNEITRTLAEHGSFGILALMVLFATPLFLYLDNKNHIYLLCFLLFWLLTINHAAMRIAAPAFVYSLSILKVIKEEDVPVQQEEKEPVLL
ncbi:MAG TPA: O-antigen ligase family protein [Flavobacterium sp.]|nr:O-antigen ligase family protein [Flavobacterium sp.]